jgi:hypothetical protein
MAVLAARAWSPHKRKQQVLPLVHRALQWHSNTAWRHSVLVPLPIPTATACGGTVPHLQQPSNHQINKLYTYATSEMILMIKIHVQYSSGSIKVLVQTTERAPSLLHQP